MGKKVFTAIVVLCGACMVSLLCGCRFEQKRPPVIVVSVTSQKALLERIAGSRYEVHSMLGNGSNPDEFEPNTNNMMWLEGSAAYFAIGNIGFESAIMTRIGDVSHDVKVFDTSKGIALIGRDSVAGSVNPFVWMSVKNSKIIARNMLAALIELEPKRKKYFTHRYNKLAAELDAVDHALTAVLDTCDGRAFAECGQMLAYFARDYNLRAVEVMPGHVSDAMVAKCRQSGAKMLFVPKTDGGKPMVDYGGILGLKTQEVKLGDDWIDGLQLVAKGIARGGE